MGVRWKHFKTICNHKKFVYQECKACGIIWQGITHDLSKFSPIEFTSSAKYFQGDRSPIDKEKEERGYSMAWLHHKGRNPHHWEWWIDFGKDGEIILNLIPYKYVVEMICDWIGAGKAYNKEEWKESDPIDYYYKVRAGRHIHPRTEELIIKFLKCIRDNGLDEFHRMAKCKAPYSNLRTDYEGVYL